MKKSNATRWALVAIVAVGLFLRVAGIGGRDLVGDEGSDSFRAVGYLDYLGTSFQTQPVDWYKDEPLPLWTYLSFHDHPPLSFAIRHIFFRLFGDSIFVARLPAALFGAGSIIFLFLFLKKLFKNQEHGELIALIAAGLFAIGGATLWIDRTALIEPFLLFFIFMALWAFFLFLEKKRYWWILGFALGLILLTKYTGAFLIPCLISYLLIARRDVFKDWRLYGVFGIAILIFSPVIFYNFFLFRARGHFDLQLAYLFRQLTPEWTGLIGKSQDPFNLIGKNLLGVWGIPFLVMVLVGFFASFASFFRKKNNAFLFLWLYIFWSTALFFVIGSAHRFLILFAPAFTIFAGFGFVFFWYFISRRSFLTFALRSFIIILAIFEIWYAAQKNFIAVSDYGSAALDRYFAAEFKDRESAVIPQSDNRHLNEVIQRFAKNKTKSARYEPFGIIYDDRIGISTLLWTIDRRFFYHSVPALYVENYLSIVKEKGTDFFKGFDLYFIEPSEEADINPFKREKIAGKEFETLLKKKGLTPVILTDRNGGEMYRVYKFSSSLL